MKRSDLNHLCILLNWIGSKIGQEDRTAPRPGAAETYASRLLGAMTYRKVGVAALAAATGMHYQGVKQAIEGKSKSFSAANNMKVALFLEISPHWLATGQGAMLVRNATVPADVVGAVKALEKTLANGGPEGGAASARAIAGSRAAIDVAPDATAGPALPLSDLAIEQGLAEIGITVWGPRAEDWAAGAEYTVRLMRECLPKPAAEALPDRLDATCNAACRGTTAAPPALRRDEAGGAGAAGRGASVRVDPFEGMTGTAPQASEAVRANEGEPSPTAGMSLGQRIAHVGGRANAQGYIEFGSPMAVNALIQHVLRDLPARPQAAENAKAWLDLFWSVAKELNCLPSSFVDGNEHVLRAARQARVALAAKKPESEAC